jgi:hypothetical protein
MASLTQRAKRRSSLFFGANFSLTSLKTSSPVLPTDQSFTEFKHSIRHSTPANSVSSKKSELTEPLFQDSFLSNEAYLSSDEDEVSSSSDRQGSESPTFSDFAFNEDDFEFDEAEQKDSLNDFGLGLAVETFKPSDVARKVSIMICKPKVVDISPPTSPVYSRNLSPLRQSLAPESRPNSTYFNTWSGFYYNTGTSSSSQSQRSSSSSISDASKNTEATTVSIDSVYSAQEMPSPPIPQRANALKRQSHRLSTSFSRSFLAKASDAPVTPMEPVRPATSNSFYIPAHPAVRLNTVQLPAGFPDVSTMPPPPEVPRSKTPALRKKKSMADGWFKRRSVSTYI